MNSAQQEERTQIPADATRLRRTYSRYRDASRSLRVPASRQSRHGLDWLNFFLADMQTGYGSFVAYYLAGLGWSQGAIGLALTVDNLLAVLGQIPGGAIADGTTRKRGLAALAIIAIAVASLVLAFAPSRWLIYGAEGLHGLTAGVTTAAIASISLGLVQRNAVSYRVGRNYRFSAAGNALTAAAWDWPEAIWACRRSSSSPPRCPFRPSSRSVPSGRTKSTMRGRAMPALGRPPPNFTACGIYEKIGCYSSLLVRSFYSSSPMPPCYQRSVRVSVTITTAGRIRHPDDGNSGHRAADRGRAAGTLGSDTTPSASAANRCC